MATRYVGLTAAGAGDGTSAANRDNIADINTQLTAAGPGGTVIMTTGGTTGNPITVKPQTVGGVILRGNRADPWTVGAIDGDPLFRLDAGASNLRFEDLYFEDFGNGCFHVFAVTTIDNIEILRCLAPDPRG